MKKRTTRRTPFKSRNTVPIRGYTRPEISDAYRRICSAAGVSCSDDLRTYIEGCVEKNHKPAYGIKDKAKLPEFGPKFFPGRCASYGVIPRMRITV